MGLKAEQLAALSDEQLQALKAAGGDLTKLDDPMFESIASSVKNNRGGQQQGVLSPGARGALVATGEGLGRYLDAPSGVVRTGVAALKPGLLTKQDMVNAAHLQFPTTSQLLERSGVGEMGRIGPVTGRGAIGFLGDATAGAVGTAGLGAALNAAGDNVLAKGAKSLLLAPEAAMETQGQNIYRSGLKNVDRAAELVGKEPTAVSDTLFKFKVKGSAKNIENRAADVADTLYNKQQDILKAATDAGVTVPLDDALKPAMDAAEKAAKSKVKGVSDAAMKVIDRINGIKDHAATIEAAHGATDPLVAGPGRGSFMTPLELSQTKSSLYNALGDQAWQDVASSPEGAGLLKQVAFSAKDATEKAVSQAHPELGGLLAETNSDLGNILSASDALSREATKEGRKNALTSIDALAAAANPKAAIAKKSADFAKGTYLRTTLGSSMQNNPNMYGALLRETGAQILPTQGEQK